MKYFIFAFLYLATISLFSKEIYISSSLGNDSNDGSIASPLKTVAAAPKENAKIFLRRGDIFYEELKGFKNCEISAYAKGSKPVVCGFRILKNPDAWEKMPNGIWRLDISKDENFAGFLNADSAAKFNVGAIYDISADKLYGHLVNRFNAINRDGDFFAANNEWCKPADTSNPKHKFKYVYFKFPRNPSSKNSAVAFVMAAHGISNLHNCTVRDISVKGFGKHGVCSAFDCAFDSLEIDIIGGCIQTGYSGGWVRFGNGIEFWITAKKPANNNSVKNCRISRTYDCGATIQGISDGDICAENILFENNIFYHCRQAFEHFLRSKNGGSAFYKNCKFVSNIAFDCGENCFSTPEVRDAALLSYDGKNHAGGLLIEDNIFWNSNAYCITGFPATLKNNKFYIHAHHYLISANGNATKTLWGDSQASIAEFESKFPTNSVLIITDKTKSVESELRAKVFP